MDRAGVNYPQRVELRGDPERAARLLRYALSRPRVRNAAAFAVARYREGRDHAEAARRARQAEEVVGGAASIEELEASFAFAVEHRLPAAALEAIAAELELARARASEAA